MSDVFGQPLASGRVALYVPSTQDIDKALSPVEYQAEVDRVLSLFCELFGGATATPSVGVWQAANGSLVKEVVTVVYAFADLTDAQKVEVRKLAGYLAKRLSQEGVLVEVNGTSYLVAPF